MNPLVSIVVPVYNVGKHLIKCLDSLLHQSYDNYEIVLVNDGSTDDSGQLCDEYMARNNRIRVFHLKNGGVSRARNYGIDHSQGKYILFVDSDDFVDEGYISNMVQLTDQGQVDLVVSGIKRMKLIGQNINYINELSCKAAGRYTKLELKNIMGELLDSSYFNYCYSKLIKRELLLQHGIRFDSKISLGEDTLFVLDVVKHCNVIYISYGADYNYLIHSDETLTFKFRPDKFVILNHLARRMNQFFKEENCYTEDVQAKLDVRYLEMIRFCLDENFKSLGFSKFFRRLENIRTVLRHEDVSSFITSDKSIIHNYPPPLINAIKSKNPLRYVCTYYSLIFSKKVRELL